MSETKAAAQELAISYPDDLHVVRNSSFYERKLKRSFDVVVGTVLALIGLPVIAAIALGIRLRLGKGVLYIHQRVGRDGEPFTIYKFRTMRPDRRQNELDLPQAQDRRTEHKQADDPRHTRLGRILRKLSLDELPQLLNVLRGDMSLVGPRPELVGVARQRGYLDHPRHDVKPGMTGPYQVSNLRLNGDLRDGLDLDEQYVNNLTFGNDLRYLVKTITVMFGDSTGS